MSHLRIEKFKSFPFRTTRCTKVHFSTPYIFRLYVCILCILRLCIIEQTSSRQYDSLHRKGGDQQPPLGPRARKARCPIRSGTVTSLVMPNFGLTDLTGQYGIETSDLSVDAPVPADHRPPELKEFSCPASCLLK